MDMNVTPLFRQDESARIAETTRGACPSLARPMQTGDGLIIRVRARSNDYTVPQLEVLAAGAAAHGNGILEVTARGNLQVRGLKPETVEPLTQAILASGIDPASGLAIECPPLAGRDPAVALDPRDLAEALRTAVAAEGLTFAAKMSVIVEAGEALHLGAIAADIRLRLEDSAGGVTATLSIGGTARTARVVGTFAEADAVPAALGVLRQLAARGPRARGRDLDPADLPVLAPMLGGAADPRPPSDAALPVTGLFACRDGRFAAGLALRFGQIEAPVLTALLAHARAAGAEGAAGAPRHGLIFTGMTRPAAEDLLAAAAGLGLLVRADDPAALIDLCAGTRGCASAFYDTHALAERLMAGAPALFDGSVSIHLSGCSKGCAHPSASTLTVSAASFGYGLVVNGSASDSPAAYIAASDIATAIDRLAALLAGEKRTGETTGACLERLGPGAIARAMQLG